MKNLNLYISIFQLVVGAIGIVWFFYEANKKHAIWRKQKEEEAAKSAHANTFINSDTHP